MGSRYPEIPERMQQFIAEQKMFFVGTAGGEGRVNLSPKGMDSFRVVNAQRVVWLNLTGSGNETAVHVEENGRMTVMFVAYEGSPMILRLYGTAKAVHHNDAEWDELYQLFEPLPGARQIFDLSIDLVQTSCGMGVPLYDYVGERNMLAAWADKHGEEAVKEYWKEKNQVSLDGKATGIVEKNL